MRIITEISKNIIQMSERLDKCIVCFHKRSGDKAISLASFWNVPREISLDIRFRASSISNKQTWYETDVCTLDSVLYLIPNSLGLIKSRNSANFGWFRERTSSIYVYVNLKR